MKKLLSKAAALRFLKKTVIFCFVYIVIFSIAMVVIFCIKGEYPEQLTIVTFAYFSVESIISGVIKSFETFSVKRKNRTTEYSTETITDETPVQPGEE